ncbi:hypothetical protein ACF0H5_007996 [Mactra antiquata]
MASIGRYINLYGFILLVLIGLVLSKNKHGKRKKAKSDEWNVKYYPNGRGQRDKRLDIHLTCKKGYVLTDIEILAGRDNYNCKRKSIYGKTADLITAINNCEWKRTCTIKFTRGIMIECEQNPDGTDQSFVVDDFSCNCLLEDVEFMRPIQAKCVKESEITTICDGKTLSKKQGLIKSHELLPWHYGASMKNQTCSKSVDIKNGKSKKSRRNRKSRKSREKKLVLSVKFVHLYDGDNLSLDVIDTSNNVIMESYDLGNDTYGTRNIEIKPETNKLKTMQLQFMVLDDTRGGGGFIICYREETIKATVTNVCDKLKRVRKPRLTVERESTTEAAT